MSNNGSTLQSVDNALRVLEAFSAAQPELGIAELSRKLGLGKSTIFRLVSTLEARGYLTQDPVSSKYRLGLKALYIGGLVLRQISLVRDAQPYLEELVRRSGEVAHLVVLEQGEATFINKVEPPRTMRMGSSIGARLPAYGTATGKVLLAHLPQEDLERYLKETRLTRFTPNTFTDPDKLRAYLQEVRAQGYALDREETEEGLTCIAAPIRDNRSKVVAAVSISGPTVRIQRRLEELRELVTSVAADISRSLGWLKA